MSSILCFGSSGAVAIWDRTLRHEGHDVERVDTLQGVQERFSGDVVDILIIDMSNADTGEALLIPQARAAWPGCKVIVATSSYAFRTSEFYRMGLWSPDQLMLRPVNLRVLTATVNFLAAQIRSEEIKRHIPPKRHDDARYTVRAYFGPT